VTLNEFELAKADLSCRLCGAVGLIAVENANNGGVRPGCPACGSSNPLAGVQWLKRTKRANRPSGAYETSEVWEANGNCCAFCGKTRLECERFKIGLTVQHVVPFSEPGGIEGPLIPFCARCQQSSAAALAETQCVRRYLESLEEQIARIRAKAGGSDDAA